MKVKKILILIIAVAICISATACTAQHSDAEIKEQLTEFSTTEKAQSHIKTTDEENDGTSSTESTAKTSDKSTTVKNSNKKNSSVSSNTNAKTTAKETTSEKLTTETKVTKADTTQVKQSVCYITIECKSVLDNLDKLNGGHLSFVPKNGYYINNYQCKYEKGDTVYDILKRACHENNIKITAKNTTFGIYVSGINNLDEKDCGSESGWLYSVNSVTPSVSCDKYDVNRNDKIVFTYICEFQ